MNSAHWAPFEYRDFYDLPRMILFERDGALYLLDCPFDEARDDYARDYAVYRFGRDMRSRIAATRDWRLLPGLGEKIGAIPVGRLQLDPTRRQSVDTSVLEAME